LKETLAYLEKLTLHPDEVGPGDIKNLREHGLSDTAIREAAYVCSLFNVIDRLADTFDFNIMDQAGFDMGAVNLIKRGYKI
jgi:alkylhydroperoxidase family enzyme